MPPRVPEPPRCFRTDAGAAATLLVAAVIVVDAAVVVVVVVLAAVVAGVVRASPCRPARPLGGVEAEVLGCCCGCCRRLRGAAAAVDAAAHTMPASTRGADQASCPASSNSG